MKQLIFSKGAVWKFEPWYFAKSELLKFFQEFYLEFKKHVHDFSKIRATHIFQNNS